MRKRFLLLLLLAAPLAAATRTWSGNVGNLWSNPANWNGGAPAAGDDLVFPANVSWVSTNDLPSGTAFRSITVNGTGYRIGGNAIVLGAGGLTINSRFIVSLIHGEVRFARITLAESQTWTGMGELTVVGPTDVNGKTLTIAGGSRIGFDAISGTGAIVVNNAYGDVTSGTSTYSGTLTVNGGFFSIGGSSGEVEVTGSGLSGDNQVNVWNTTLGLTAAALGNVTLNGSAALSLDARLISSSSSSLVFVPASGDPAWFVVAGDVKAPAAVNVAGRVALGNSRLVVRGNTFSPVTLIRNRGAAPIVGTFLGIAEGAVISNGNSLRVSYMGGANGNDVTLTPLSSYLPPPAMMVTTSFSPSVPGQIVTFTATVTGSGSAEGSIAFHDGGLLLGSSALNAFGQATLTTSFAAGSHLITAAYLGSSTLATNQVSVRQTVAAGRRRAVSH
jgi:hypothetical protein